MARVPGHEAVYEAAEHWAKSALHSDDSLFTPGEPVWSLDNLNDLHDRFVGNLDVPGKGFFQKFEKQLEGAPPATVQLAAEALYVYYLIVWPGKVSSATKRARIDRVLAWTRPHPPIPDLLNVPLDAGLIDLGPALGQIHASIQVVVEFGQRWKAQSPEHRANALADPWIFKNDLNSIDFPFASTQRNALLHLIHPDHFEPITSMQHRSDLERSFSNLLSRRFDDIDKDLFEIRKRLNETYTVGFHFYDENIRFVWDSSMSDLERFVRWGYRFFGAFNLC